ncbi:MAG: hypothetical protein JOZ69_02070 [Myxococcales bacterium]|nr:hypothetical protein [Myxococcales bacterium]
MRRGLGIARIAMAVITAIAAIATAPWTAPAIGCGKKTSRAAPSSSEADPDPEPDPERPDASGPMDAREAAEWAAAVDAGEPEELARLADLVGCRGLRERAGQAALRSTALQAMRYCPDFSELPWLARVAAEGSDADARAALEAADLLAARPRRATDPEDAAELHAGCAALLALARDEDQPRERRLLSIRALRMLADRGCVTLQDVPVIRKGEGG